MLFFRLNRTEEIILTNKPKKRRNFKDGVREWLIWRMIWKVFKNIYQHVDIVEEKKVDRFSLGKWLIIDGNEILATYVHPIGTYSPECINYKYIRPALDSTKRDQIESVLTSEQKSAPKKIQYAFICDRINPGHFLLKVRR